LEILHYYGVNLRNHWLIMHPGATAPSRRYPVEGFAEVARRLHRDNGYQIILTGSEEDKPILEGIRETCGVPTVTFGGMTNIEQVAALIAICPGLITNNSAPAHIAAATNTPLVDLYALTNPQHTPWLVRHHVLSHDVPCKYCYKSVCPENHHNCLRLIEPAQVIAAALDLFDSAFANRFR
jgi:lipopolysaccharide heptosyltransferase II